MQHDPASVHSSCKETAAHPLTQDQEAPPRAVKLVNSAWYSTKDLAQQLRIDASTLRRWRTARPPQGPPFVHVSDRVIMYSALDVEEWLRSRRIDPQLAA